jgi:hypothetical protein
MGTFTKRPHHGVRNYTGQEATNLVLGQGGFDIIQGSAAPGTIAIAGEGDYKDVRMWIAIKAVEGVDAEVCCKTEQGDDFAKNGVYQAGAGQEMTLKDQDIVNGSFTTIRVGNGTSIYILAYRG